MQRINLLLYARQAAVILPATRTLESLEQIGKVLLTTTIALPVIPNLPRGFHIDLDGAHPQQAMAMAVRTTAGIDTCLAD